MNALLVPHQPVILKRPVTFFVLTSGYNPLPA